MQNASNLSHHRVFPGFSHPVDVTGVLMLISLFKLTKSGYDASNHRLRFRELQTFCLGNLPLPHYCHCLRTRTKIKFSLNYFRLTTPVPNNFKLLYHYTTHFCTDSIFDISHKHLSFPSLTKQMKRLPFVTMKHTSSPQKKWTREMAS